MRITAFLILFMLIIANLTIRSRISHRPTPFDVFEFVYRLREVGFDIVCFGSFIFFLGLFLPFNCIILEAIHYGMSPGLAQYLVSILNAASLFGRTIPGWIADKIGRYNMMFLTTVFSGVITLADGCQAGQMRPSSSLRLSLASAVAPSYRLVHH